jgi:hypothetical protein
MHDIADIKLRVGTYGFIFGGTNLKTTKGRTNP